MTRTKWRIHEAARWLLQNREAVLDIALALLLSVLILSIAMCSVRKVDESFKDARLQGVYSDSNESTYLVLYEKGGVVQGREFQDCLQAHYFAEAFK